VELANTLSLGADGTVVDTFEQNSKNFNIMKVKFDLSLREIW
jgi:hypothetical protein